VSIWRGFPSSRTWARTELRRSAAIVPCSWVGICGGRRGERRGGGQWRITRAVGKKGPKRSSILALEDVLAWCLLCIQGPCRAEQPLRMVYYKDVSLASSHGLDLITITSCVVLATSLVCLGRIRGPQP
jgi:hypothetical protein